MKKFNPTTIKILSAKYTYKEKKMKSLGSSIECSLVDKVEKVSKELSMCATYLIKGKKMLEYVAQVKTNVNIPFHNIMRRLPI